MRAVAERADVAVGTLYRYFPSKVHLLVSALGREFERIDAKTDRAVLAAGATPYQRLNIMVGKLNRAMQRNPLLTEAMTRAFVFADASAAGEVDHVGKLMDSMGAGSSWRDSDTAVTGAAADQATSMNILRQKIHFFSGYYSFYSPGSRT